MLEYGDPRLPVRYWEKVRPEPNTGCWLWSAATNREGQGKYMTKKPQVRLAHLVMYDACYGHSAGRGTVLQTCGVRLCVSPWHLVLLRDVPYDWGYFWSRVDRSYHPKGCWIWTKGKTAAGYGQVVGPEGRDMAHRVAYREYVGAIPEGIKIDHTCHVHACVRPEHLRLATTAQNGENRAGLDRDNKSGYRGASYHKASGKYRAVATSQGKQYHVGLYDTLEQAAEAARLKRNALYTHNDLDKN